MPLDQDLPRPLIGLSPWVRLVHDFQTRTDFRLPPRMINDHALLYFHEGRGSYRCREQTWAISPGCLAIMRPDREHEFSALPGTAFHMFNIHFDLRPRPDSAHTNYHHDGPARGLATDEILPDDLPEFMGVMRREVYRGHFLAALHAFRVRGVAAALQVSAAITCLLAELYHQVADSGSSQADREGLDRAVRLMHEHLGRSLSLADLVQVSGLGRSRFTQRFHQCFGCPPMAWLRRLRLESARQDLLYRDQPIKAVAEHYGFANVHHFTRAFTAWFGQPPARLRSTLAHGSEHPHQPTG